MKKFEVELAKKGWPVVTRDGHEARVICYDRISRSGHGTVVALITFDEPINEDFVFVDADGRCDYLSEYPIDLFLADSWEGHDENGNPLVPESAFEEPSCGERKSSTYQVGGDHYSKLAIQPWDYIRANNLDFFQGSVISYVTRYKDKGGIQDLKKSIHYLENMIENDNKRNLPNP